MQQYRDKQAEIYQSFRDKMSNDELTSLTTIDGVDAGFLVVLKYNTDITDAFGKLSSAINLAMPSLEYGAHNIHTTVLTGPKIDSQAGTEHIDEQWESLSHWFFQQGEAIAQMYFDDIRIQFTEYLYNDNSLIAASQANDAFWQMTETLMTAANLMGYPMKMPWGSHSTVSRFLNNGKRLSPLDTLIKCTPALSETKPVRIVLVQFECDQRGFRFIRQSDDR